MSWSVDSRPTQRSPLHLTPAPFLSAKAQASTASLCVAPTAGALPSLTRSPVMQAALQVGWQKVPFQELDFSFLPHDLWHSPCFEVLPYGLNPLVEYYALGGQRVEHSRLVCLCSTARGKGCSRMADNRKKRDLPSPGAPPLRSPFPPPWTQTL